MQARHVLIASLALCCSGVALADGHRKAFTPSPAYQEECASCHVAYPPGLLSAASWTAVMGGLKQHFGVDASLPAAKQKELQAYLTANAGRRESNGADGKPLLRISDTAWFQREHRPGHDGLTAAMFKHPSVKSVANCAGCHVDAERGDYSERNIRLPR